MAELAGSLIGAGVSIIGAGIAWWRSLEAKWDQDRAALRSLQNKAIELAMQYPHLERESFCKNWPPATATEDEKERYDNYCCFVFNMIAQAWRVTGKKAKKVPGLVAVREFVTQHHTWWDKEGKKNLNYYDQDYVDYISSVINDLKKSSGIT